MNHEAQQSWYRAATENGQRGAHGNVIVTEAAAVTAETAFPPTNLLLDMA